MDERLALLCRRYKEGWTQQQIAEELGVSQQIISRNLAEQRRRWRESALRDFDELRGQQLEELAWVVREAREGWERSKLQQTRERTHRRDVRRPVPGADGRPATTEDVQSTTTAELLRESTPGDPAFLAEVNRAVRERSELLGLKPLGGLGGNVTPEALASQQNSLAEALRKLLPPAPDGPVVEVEVLDLEPGKPRNGSASSGH
jgi:transcriptional regulator with XRE-family HTH domain